MDNIDKWDCAPDQASCMAAGCCWVPATEKVFMLMMMVSMNVIFFLFSQDTPWCFFPDNVPTPGDLCKEFHWEAAGPGFTEEEYAVMFSNYEANLNIRGTGAIIAAPDAETPGGDYRCCGGNMEMHNFQRDRLRHYNSSILLRRDQVRTLHLQ